MVQQAQQKDNLSASGQLENSYNIFQALGSIQEWLHVFNRDKLKFVISSAAYMLEVADHRSSGRVGGFSLLTL